MKFGPVPVDEAVGGLAVHGVRAGDVVIKKGRAITAEDAARLEAAGIGTVVVARLEPDDVGEDEAAARLSHALAGANIEVGPAFTGRANLFSSTAGVLRVDRAGIDAINAIDEAITVATLPAFKPVLAGEMVGTVKIIPYAAPGAALDQAVAAARASDVLGVAPYRRRHVGVVSTTLPGLKPTVITKTVQVLADRLAPTGARLSSETRIPHEADALSAELRRLSRSDTDLVIVFGASAIADRRDVIPTAIEAAGGRVEHFGMPVDPGNLLLIGRLGDTPVIGAPGCARSPKENGFDWVLHRLLADIPVTRADVVGMGAGGLLMEIVSRPQPREMQPAPAQGDAVAAIVLAAGQSRRMGGPNKLLAELDGKPLVRRAVEAALASRARPVTVVTGHQRPAVQAALGGLDATLAHNPDFAEGLSTSLRVGIAALPPEVAAAVVSLADMPGVTSAIIDRLIAAFREQDGAAIVVPTASGKRGNPVLWSRHFFPALGTITGDVGARHLIGENSEAVVEVEVGAAAALDLDTPEAMREAGGVLQGV